MLSRKRFILLAGSNIAIVVFLGIISYILQTFMGVSFENIPYGNVVVFSLVLGFGGAYINLRISKRLAKRVYDIQLIDENVNNPTYRMIYSTVLELSQQQDIPIPEVGIYRSKECNAFATGPSKTNSLIAVSTGLLERMNDQEIRGVLAHEMAHIVNGDMVTTTLLQGIINTFIIFISRVVARIISVSLDEEGELNYGVYFVVSVILDIVLGLVGTLILAFHSRKREYRADKGSADMVGKNSMIAALRKLQTIQGNNVPQDEFSTLKMTGGKKRLNLFSTHPSLEKRIERLKNS